MRKLIGSTALTFEQMVALVHKHRCHTDLHFAKINGHDRLLVVAFPRAPHTRETLLEEGIHFLPVVEDPTPIGPELAGHWPAHHGVAETDTAFRAQQKIHAATGQHPFLNTTVY